MIGTALGAAVGSHAALKITVGTLTAALTVGGTAAFTANEPDTEHCIVIDAASDARLTTPRLDVTGHGGFGLAIDDLVELDGDGVAALYIGGVDATLADAADVEVCLGEDRMAAVGNADAAAGASMGVALAGDDGRNGGQASTGESDTADGTGPAGDGTEGKELAKDADGDGAKSLSQSPVAEAADGESAEGTLAITATNTHEPGGDTAAESGFVIEVSTEASTTGNDPNLVAETFAVFLNRRLG